MKNMYYPIALCLTAALGLGCSGPAEDPDGEGGGNDTSGGGTTNNTTSTNNANNTVGTNNTSGGGTNNGTGGGVNNTSGGGTNNGTGALVCDPDDPEYVYDRAGEQQTRCFGVQQCVVGSDGEALCGCEQTGTRCIADTPGSLPDLHEPSRIVKAYACASENADPADPGNLVEECAPGFRCLQDDGFNDDAPACASSIAPEAQDHPFAEFGCANFIEGFKVPTKLGVDCRCRILEQGAVSRDGKNDDYAWPDGDWPQGPLLACQSEEIQRTKTWKVPAGSGPKFDGWKENGTDRWLSVGMDVAERDLYAVVRHTSPFYAEPTASIVRWDLDANVREVVTGAYYDPRLGRAEAGSGYTTAVDCNATTSCANPLWGVGSAALGDDGWIYTLASRTGEGYSSDVELVRTQATTGLRELVWRSEGAGSTVDPAFGQCRRSTPRGGTGEFVSVPWVLSSLERGPDGTFYMAFYDTSNAGKGVASISADGSTCTVLSRYASRDGDPAVGAGFEPQSEFEGLFIKDGALHAVADDDLFEIDLTTGARARVSYDTTLSVSLGTQSVFWDATREVFWLAGDDQIALVGAIVDPATGRRESIWNDTGFREFGQDAILKSGYAERLGIARSITGRTTMLTNGNNYLGGTLALDPDDPDIVWAVITGGRLMKYDLTTFNNYTFSY